MIPDSGVRPPSELGRVLASAVAYRQPPATDVLLSESPRSLAPYHDALLRRWSAVAINPGVRLLLAALARRRGLRSNWLVDGERDVRSGSMVTLPDSSDHAYGAVRSAFLADVPHLAGWAALGRSLPARVAVAAQDVSPAVRSALIGFQAGGGRVVTMEHGISGGYTEQVRSVADHLGAWGPIQAAYHRQADPSSINVVELGWPRLQTAATGPRSSDEPTIDVLFFGQPATPLSAGGWPEDAIAAHAIVERYADRHPGRHVAVKFHPATRAYNGTEFSHTRVARAAGDSLLLIGKARIVAAATSTTALEAMAIGRPVIRLANRGYVGPTDFLRDSGAVVSVLDAEDFDAAAEELLSSQTAYLSAVQRGREFAAAFVAGIDRPGAAEGRLVDLVGQLLNA